MEYYRKLRPLLFYTLISIWLFLIASTLLALHWSQSIPEVHSLVLSNLDARFPLIETNQISSIPYLYQGFFTLDSIRYYSLATIFTSSIVFALFIIRTWQHDSFLYARLSRVKFLVGIIAIPGTTVSITSVVYNLINGLYNPLNPLIISNQVIIVILLVIYLYFNNNFTEVKYDSRFKKYQLTHILVMTIYSIVVNLVRFNLPLLVLVSQLIIIGITIPLFINFTVKKVGI